ncbi:MAG: exodeoxyribonuclease VII small subunit [Rhodobacteraceae bacterium]|nr:exodeoxyribonuclease VII small subunit [Paracoccaceae bacterium]
MTPDKPVAEMTFEEALRALEQVVDRLDKAEVPLEESIDLYEQGARLKAHCEAKLARAQERVEQITRGEGGAAMGTSPLDPD